MTVEGLEDFTTDELIAELINRTTFAGLVVWHEGDVKQGRIDAGQIKFTKSPPLTLLGTVQLLETARELAPGMFDEPS